MLVKQGLTNKSTLKVKACCYLNLRRVKWRMMGVVVVPVKATVPVRSARSLDLRTCCWASVRFRPIRSSAWNTHTHGSIHTAGGGGNIDRELHWCVSLSFSSHVFIGSTVITVWGLGCPADNYAVKKKNHKTFLPLHLNQARDRPAPVVPVWIDSWNWANISSEVADCSQNLKHRNTDLCSCLVEKIIYLSIF